MPRKTPRGNGNKPAPKNTKDVEMTESSKSKGKKVAKDGDEEMTVVVPPSKPPKQSSKGSPDAEDDVDMDVDKEDDAEEKVDPVVQTVAGEHQSHNDITNIGCNG